MKDNFSNSNPFGRNKSKYSEHLENYIGMVNQPTAADAFGDAFSQAGSAPAVGAQAHEANALLSGIGAGIKGAANSQRQEKLSPYMQLTAQLTAKAAELEAQVQEEQQNSMQVKQFFKQNASPIAELSKSSLAGDTQASNQIAQGILRNYKQTFGDETVGNFDHYHNGTIYYENLETGAVEGRNVSSLMYQAGINPVELFGQDAPAIEAGLSAGAKLNYENTLEANRLALEKERAGINMTNAPKTEKDVIDPSKMAQDLDVLDKQLEEIGEAGSQDANSRIMSVIAPEIYRLTPQQTSIDTLGQLTRGKMFKAFGYRNETEFEQIPSISSRNSKEQNKAIIQQYRNLFLKDLDAQQKLQTTSAQSANNTPKTIRFKPTGQE